MSSEISRRVFLKWGAVTGAGVAFSGSLLSGKASGALPPDTTCQIQEAMPVSPFILSPFVDKLPVPKAMATGWRPDPTDPVPHSAWWVRKAAFLDKNLATAGVVVPGPALNQQDSYGHRLPNDVLPDGQTVAVEHAGTHQIWPTPVGANKKNFTRLVNWPAAGVAPIRYHIRVQPAQHSFTTSKVKPVDIQGNPVVPPPGSGVVLDGSGNTILPPSTIYGFNGTFPGPMINAQYGKPLVVRFENDLDKIPANLQAIPEDVLRGDFGAPDLAFLTHLHNGHTAPESDGQPHYMQINEGGYVPADWVDNLYLMYPAGGDSSEIQSFFWFHDHRMHFTGANVYKGMVGIMPLYDAGMPAAGGGIVPGTGLDTGNESDPAPNLKFPGVRTNHPNGTFDVKYDIPFVFYDVALDDGITPHADRHIQDTNPAAADFCGNIHPEQWGKSYFRHFPNHGFVGDIFTVNGTAYPVLTVFKRKYRFRFLDASVSRIYELSLMTSKNGPQPKPGTQGQWQIPDGKLAVQWTQIASMGGLLPTPVLRDSVQVWPATRNEHVIDFAALANQGITTLYLTNIVEMPDGRLPNFQPGTAPDNRAYKVPLVKIVISGAALPEPDNSVMPKPGDALRPMPVMLPATQSASFTLERSGSLGDESQWVINKLPFDPLVPLLTVKRDHPIIWTNKNGGGGWVHPMHMHMEEHHVLSRTGSKNDHPDDIGKSDVTNLDPAETVTFYRNFRTFTGRYVAHCHNLAHEDHNMMFGWSIVP